MPETTHGRIRTTSTRHKRSECHSLSFKRKQLMRPSAVYCFPRQSIRWELSRQRFGWMRFSPESLSPSRVLFTSEAFLYLCPSRGWPARIRTHLHWFGWKAVYSWVFTCFSRIIKPRLTRLIWLSFQLLDLIAIL